MAKKMYYTEEEAVAKLGAEEFQKLVSEQKLAAFQDGARKMYKADQVDALAGAGEMDIELTPADSAAGDVINLADTDTGKGSPKEDSMISSEGISIFDDEDLDIEAADPMAKTQIAPTLEDQISIEGVGSGSGLLDLTRESDDTSLGAEVLDQIDIEGAVGSSIGGEAITEPEPYAPQPGATVVRAAFVEEIDASAGLFNGIIIGSSLLMILIGAVTLAAMVGAIAGEVPSYLQAIAGNVTITLVVGVVIVALATVVGYLVGKSSAARQQATQELG